MPQKPKQIAVIGGGPAGLMAAEILANAGQKVTIYEQKPSMGRKFLMAGRGGLNITHSEDLEKFLTRYGSAEEKLTPHIQNFTPQDLQKWCADLGEKTFIGSSGRVFPESFKTSPLLRAWIKRLEEQGVEFKMRSVWQGWDDQNRSVINQTPIEADAIILALGGASWPKLGSDGKWVDILKKNNIEITRLRPANCGFEVAWSDIFRDRFAGTPLKSVTLSFKDKTIQGEIMINTHGVEGGAIYALSAPLRDEIEQQGQAILNLDLRPGLTLEELTKRLQKPRQRQSLTTYLQKAAALSPVAIGLLMELPERKELNDYKPEKLAALIKYFSLKLTAPFSIERAISTAGGISWDAFDKNFMLKNKPGVFIAGEMLDWEAPTGGYLLQATFSTAIAAANGALNWLAAKN